jgi:hypothetical protein
MTLQKYHFFFRLVVFYDFFCLNCDFRMIEQKSRDKKLIVSLRNDAISSSVIAANAAIPK